MGNIWVLFIIKILAFIFICFVFTKVYSKIYWGWMKYSYGFLLTLIIILSLFAAYNNWIVYISDSDDMVEYSVEEKTEYYGSVVNLEPVQQEFPGLLFLFLFSLLNYFNYKYLEYVNKGDYENGRRF